MKYFILFFALAVITVFVTISVNKTGENDQVLTDTFQCTHVQDSSQCTDVQDSTFKRPKFKTFEKRGMKLWIMEPDTFFTTKGNPIILSGWEVTIDGNPCKTYRSGDFDKLPPEIQKLFWFKAD